MQNKPNSSGSQSKSRVPSRARPPFAASQENKILELLRKAGSRGVSKKSLVFELHFTQASARIHALEQQGHKIRHERRSGDDYVTFVLESSPSAEQRTSNSISPEARSDDWYERETGKARPGTAERDSPSGLPLFDAGARP